MRILYSPSGRAGEYADKGLACNLYSGCTHGCRYCYVPAVLHKTREQFNGSVVPVNDALARLEHDCRQVYDEPIFLSFTGDIFCRGLEAETDITTWAIKIIKDSGNRVRILTKGTVTDAVLDLLGPEDQYGVTLTCELSSQCYVWEPKAATTVCRIDSLYDAQARGIPTWVSFEPVIVPEWTLGLIEMVSDCADLVKVGKSNHLGRWDWPNGEWRKRVESIDWDGFATDVVALLKRLCVPYVIKRDLAAHLPPEQGGNSGS